MGYISEIFHRTDIQSIREFLLHGTNNGDIDSRSYETRMEDARNRVMDMLQEKLTKEDEEQIMQCVYHYIAATEDAFMEIGLQAGIMLVFQMFNNIKDYKTEK
jgi:hypothetical protein